MKRATITLATLAFSALLAIAIAAPALATGAEDLSAARAAADAGRIDDAMRLYTHAIASNDLSGEDRAYALTSLANIHDDRGESDLALADYTQAIATKPDYYWAYYNRGVLYAKQTAYTKAFADYDKAIALKPDYAPVYQARANAYDDNGQFEKAMADYDKAISLRGNEPTVYDDRGISQSGQGKYAVAIADFDRAIALNPQYGKAYSDRGNIEYNLGQFEKAVADFGSALQYRTDYPYALRGRGAAFFAMGRFTNADSDFARTVSVQPNIAYNLLWLYLARSKANLPSAVDVAALSMKFDAQDQFVVLLGALRGALPPEGLASFAQTAAASTDRSYRCSAMFFVGEAQLVRKDSASAKSSFQQARDGCDALALEREASIVELSRL
jgi:tetratricopeptide (TPR) repeat protein